MPTNGPSVGRYDSSLEGWSAVDKVAQFSNAVGRVSGGRGSATLIAVIGSQGKLVDSEKGPYLSRDGSGSNFCSATPETSDAGSLPCNTRGMHDSFRSISPGSVTSMERLPCDDNPRRVGETKQLSLGVLLTTSHVLGTPEDADGVTVTFLDQIGLMKTASLGHVPMPLRVPLRGAYGFVTSAAESNAQSPKHRGGGEDNRGGGPHDAFLDDPDCRLYRQDDAADEDPVEDVGFTLTFCDIFPVPAELASSAARAQPLTPLRRQRAAGAALSGGLEGSVSSCGGSRGISPQASSPRSSGWGRGVSYGSSAHRSSVCHLDEGTFAAADQRSLSSEAATTHMAAFRSGAASDKSNLLLVQPLPVPLLLSVIPDVKVGDAHLMITHVNNGRRCYRVRHVAAVYPDYCSYTLTSASNDECSGGPVFNSAGDFVGIQHERSGYGICLLMKSIVRSLFESDLLGMCRSPVSEVSVEKRELHGGRSEEGGGTANGASPQKVSFERCAASCRTGVLTEAVAASPRASNGGGGGGLYASAASPAHPSRSSPLVFPVEWPLSQQVPSYDAVFKEFYRGVDSLLHILCAFPYCRQMLKLALEGFSQSKGGGELEQISAIGGVGAILEAIDGYPHDEAIVSGALAAMCRICIYERNLLMFLQLDGVVSTMEIMKEYVHQPTVLQWGTYLLMSATDASIASAGRCVELLVHSGGPQLFVNVLRVYGSVQRKSAVRYLQHSRLIRWTCDLIANMLVSESRCTTVFLREDLLALLLQLLHGYTGNMYLTECLVHVFCVFVLCFSGVDAEGIPPALDVQCMSQVAVSPPELKDSLPASSTPVERLVNAQLSVGSAAPHFALMGLGPPYSTTADPHRISFFFLCQAIAGDTENCFLRCLLDICEAAVDAKSALTAHRGRPEGVLLRCFETLRLLLSWGLVRLRWRHRHSHTMPGTEESFTSLTDSHQLTSVESTWPQALPPPDMLLRLRLILETVRAALPSACELQAQLSEVEKLVQQQE
ncbi:hypothetical protein ABL78_4949 [Leptomonas seymouri]|uniref:Uncharacterized protein n=1 Tax=Leptomonas seymouri TaxID=5684 RepID=A0A0N0P5H1_LEPSE|nr:hypothetical protein ABL78_4949 [Leptomonas seymouri]|eukprot:KPI85987.1 hypothetical protein ABL78_4949 [Leptomonas seymouri]